MILTVASLTLGHPFQRAKAAEPSAKSPVISAENVDQLEPVRELDRDVWRIKRGPKRGELALLAWEQPIEIISDTDFRTLRKVAEGFRPVHFDFSHGGEFFIWSENKPGIVDWDVVKNEITHQATKSAQSHVAYSPDGLLLAVGGYGDAMKLWNRAGLLVHELDAGGEGALTPVFSPDGKILAVGNRNDTTRLFDLRTGDLLHVLPRAMTQELAFSPDGELLATGYVNGDVGVWDVKSGELLQAQASGGEEVYTVDWSPAGDILVSAGLNGKIVLWEPQSLTKLRELESPEWLIQARFTTDGTQLLTAGGPAQRDADRKITVWAVDADEN